MGMRAGKKPVPITSPKARPLPGALVWRDCRFLTLAAPWRRGLFAQIGLVAHLFSLLVPALGAQRAGLAMGLVTVMAVSSRLLRFGWVMPVSADRRILAWRVLRPAGNGGVCDSSSSLTAKAAPLLLLGVLLFGAGFGAATSMPPLIAQVEFIGEDVARVVGPDRRHFPGNAMPLRPQPSV